MRTLAVDEKRGIVLYSWFIKSPTQCETYAKAVKKSLSRLKMGKVKRHRGSPSKPENLFF
jgi:hypothetical protein